MDFIYKLVMFISRLIGFYSTIIVVRIMLTWIPQQGPDGPLLSFLKKICDPYLNFFRGKKAQIGRVDFSPILALMVLNVLQSILTMFATYGHITLAIIIAIILKGLWQYLISYVFIILLLLIGARWIAGRMANNYRATSFINMIEPVLYKPVHFVYNLFYKGKNTGDQKIVITAFFFYLVAFFAARYAINMLVVLLCKL